MSLIRSLKALADEKRLKILAMLMASDLCVGALAKQLGISKPAVSQHLQILRKAGLVKGEKRGYWTHYGVERGALKRVASELNALAVGAQRHHSICWRIEGAVESQPKSEPVGTCRDCRQQPVSLALRLGSGTPEQISECHGDPKRPGTRATGTAERKRDSPPKQPPPGRTKATP
jgi:ArsR family transcriptional regulator